MRAICCGGRLYGHRDRVAKVLSALGLTEIAHGMATGADTLCAQWALKNGVKVTPFAAAWNFWGKRAGPIRNQKMLEDFKPDAVIAFPGGAGTDDMVRRARAAGVRVIEVTEFQPGDVAK